MSKQLPKLSNCPHCWDKKKKVCVRDPATLECKRCKKYNIERNPINSIIKEAPLQFDAGAHAELYRHAWKSSLPSLDVDSGSDNFNTLTVRIESSTNHTPRLVIFRIEGPFDTRNMMLIAQLDSVVQKNFTAVLRSKAGNSRAIHIAVLAGGYTHLLCSTLAPGHNGELVTTTIDDIDYPNEHATYNLHMHLRFLLFCRLRELLQRCLEAIRFEDSKSEFRQEVLEAFASAGILRYELGYFKWSLSEGDLSELRHLPPSFKNILINWFTSIEDELTHRLRRDCGLYPNWQDAIAGSKKISRRNGETLSLTLTLHLNKFSVCGEPPPTNIYTPCGTGDIFLISPQISPALQVQAMPYDIPDGLEQLPSHVSTSVVAASDLFPDLQSLLRPSDEDEIFTD